MQNKIFRLFISAQLSKNNEVASITESIKMNVFNIMLRYQNKMFGWSIFFSDGIQNSNLFNFICKLFGKE